MDCVGRAALTWLGRVVVVGLVDERGAVPQRVQVAHRLARVVPVRHLLGELEGQLQLLLHRQEHHARQRPVAGALVVAHLCRGGGGGRQVVTGCTVAGAAASRTGGSATLGVRAAAIAAAGRVRLVARPLTTTTFQPGSAAQALICSVGGAMLVMTIHLSCCPCCCFGTALALAASSLSTNRQKPYSGSLSPAADALSADQLFQLSASATPCRMAAFSVLIWKALHAALPSMPRQSSFLSAASSSCIFVLVALPALALAWSRTSLLLLADASRLLSSKSRRGARSIQRAAGSIEPAISIQERRAGVLWGRAVDTWTIQP